jgi:CheY-like chemotaxis protein
VQDNGIGISVEALPRIFDAFEQGGVKVTRQFGGLGLGLAISKSLVELHRGSIRAESAGLGQGSTFIVELPGAETDTVGKAPHFAPAENGKQPKMRLLLVEDHHDTARTISRLLRSAGFAVTTATDVASASAATDGEPFDVLVSDLGLPDGDGYEIMRRIRALRSMPGIAMSGYGTNEDRRRSHEAGFSEHLVKPIDLPQLIAAIRRVTDNRG